MTTDQSADRAILSRAQAHTPARSGHRWLRTAAFPLAVYALTQAAVALMVIVSSPRQKVMPLGQVTFFHHAKVADPGYWEIITNWDGQWYELIATQGYQVPAARDPFAKQELWAWSFPPLFPMSVRAIMQVTPLTFAQASFGLSILAGAAAVVLFFWLMRDSGGVRTAQVAVVLFCCFTSAPLMQFAYSESLGLLFLMLFFVGLRKRWYAICLGALILLSFTRLITAPLGLVLAVHVLQGLRGNGRAWLRGWRDVVLLVASAVYSLAGSIAWLTISSLFVGSASGMARTEAYRSFRLGWFSDALEYSGILVLSLLLAILVAFVLYSVNPRSRSWGLDFRVWNAVYPLYLAAVTIMQPGIIRYLLMAPTLPMMFVGDVRSRSRAKTVQIVVVVMLLLVSQYFFVSRLVVIDRYGRIFGP